MKKLFITTFVATYFLVCGVGQATAHYSSSAVETSSKTHIGLSLALPFMERKTERLEERVENTSDRVERNRERIEESVETHQEIRQEVRSDVAQVHANRLTRRFEFYYRRLSALIEKVSKRLEKMIADGKNVSIAQAKLSSAKATLQDAKALSDQSVAGFAQIEPQVYAEQRAQALAARDLARQAREKFLQVLSLIKEAVALAKSVL